MAVETQLNFQALVHPDGAFLLPSRIFHCAGVRMRQDGGFEVRPSTRGNAVLFESGRIHATTAPGTLP